MAIEIVDFPIKNGGSFHRNGGFSHKKMVIFHSFLYVYQSLSRAPTTLRPFMGRESNEIQPSNGPVEIVDLPSYKMVVIFQFANCKRLPGRVPHVAIRHHVPNRSE